MRVRSTIGFAVFEGGEIDITTVSLTRVGAIVNWLVSKGFIPLQANADETFEAFWQTYKGTADIIKVEVSGPRP